jgi:hypothetical protein
MWEVEYQLYIHEFERDMKMDMENIGTSRLESQHFQT